MSRSMILYLLLILSLFVLVLSGCGSSTTTDTSTSDQDQQGKSIPHVLMGRDECLGCHNTSTNSPVPADHQSRTDDECTDCHKVVSNPSSTTATAIPHTLEDRDDCLKCHSEGTESGVPASHKGRTTSVCTACHQPE